MRMYDVIAKKRDGGTLSREELAFAVNGFVSGQVPDYQRSEERRVGKECRR